MATWATWWADEAHLTPCCQWASDDDLEHDPDAYDCETCPVAQQWAALDAENQEAWSVWQRVARRFVFDFHLAPAVLAPVLVDRPPDAQADLLARLALIYDRVMPSPEAKDAGHGA